jgi:GNAT superfamily N-acetyltransferase
VTSRPARVADLGDGARGALGVLLSDAATGRFPPADGSVTVVPQPSPRDCGVIDFTAHAIVFADVDPGWVTAQLPPGDLSAAVSPPFLSALGQATGRSAHGIDVLFVAAALTGCPPLELIPDADLAHPRIARARAYRDDVRAWQADGGLVTVGLGVAGRWEVAVEVKPGYRGRGLGRLLAQSARHLVPAGEPLWAQVAPGNAASVRAFLAAGFVPVGAEALLSRD